MSATLREIGLQPADCVKPLDSTDEAVRRMRANQVRCVAVIDGEELSGLVHEADLVESVAMLLRSERQPLEGTVDTQEVLVADVFDADSPLLGLDTPVVEAARLLVDEKRGAMPVLENGRLVALATQEAVIRSYGRSRGRSQPGPHSEAVLNHGSRITRTARPSDTLASACGKLSRSRLRHLPILERDRFLGFISDTDIVRAITEFGDEWPHRTVADAGPVKVPGLRPKDSLARAAELMHAQKVMALPILSRDGLLVSLLTMADLLGALVEAEPVTA